MNTTNRDAETQSKHTPGPWKEHDGFIVGKFSNGQVYDICDPRCAPPESELLDEMEANARLIAAAPELLNACRALDQAIHLWFTEGSRASGQLRDLRKILVDDCMKQASAAIAKATTGQL